MRKTRSKSNRRKTIALICAFHVSHRGQTHRTRDGSIDTREFNTRNTIAFAGLGLAALRRLSITYFGRHPISDLAYCTIRHRNCAKTARERADIVGWRYEERNRFYFDRLIEEGERGAFYAHFVRVARKSVIDGIVELPSRANVACWRDCPRRLGRGRLASARGGVPSRAAAIARGLAGRPPRQSLRPPRAPLAETAAEPSSPAGQATRRPADTPTRRLADSPNPPHRRSPVSPPPTARRSPHTHTQTHTHTHTHQHSLCH